MQLSRFLPRGFEEQSVDAVGAVRVAVREFFPILLVLVAVDVSTDGVVLARYVVLPNLSNGVPGWVYLYAFLGAGAYAVTSLAFNPKQSIVETYRLTYRLVGALPLAAGVYLLADLVVEPASLEVPIAGLAFLSGLYVRLTLRRLGDVAERLYGTEEEARQPYEGDQHRAAVAANLRRGWRRLATDPPEESDRKRAVDLLERATVIVEDDEATGQELARASELSEQARRRLDSAADGDGDGSGSSEVDSTNDGTADDGEAETTRQD